MTKMWIAEIERDDRGAETRPCLFDSLDLAIATIETFAGESLRWNYLDNGIMEACWFDSEDLDGDDWECATEWYAHIYELNGFDRELVWE